MNIKLNLNIFLFLLLFLVTNQLEIYALVMIFALIHELAHLVTGMLMGLKPETLRIMPLGFCIEFKTNIEDYNKKILKSNILSVKKIMIAIAGPFVNLIIVLFGILYNIDTNIIYANLLIFLFNMLPIYPLDGGRILKNILKMFFSNRKVNDYTNIISNVLVIVLTMISSILILIYKNIAILVIIVTLLGILIKENKKYFTYNKIYKTIDKSSNYI